MRKVFIINRDYAFSSIEKVERFLKKREGWDVELRKVDGYDENYLVYEVLYKGEPILEKDGITPIYHIVKVFNVDEECDDYETPDCSPAGEPC